MAQALKDDNFVPTILGVLNTDGKTPVRIKISNNGVKVNTTDTISFTMTPISPRDNNFNKVLMWEGTDGKSYPFVANSNGEILISE